MSELEAFSIKYICISGNVCDRSSGLIKLMGVLGLLLPLVDVCGESEHLESLISL